MPLTKEQKSKVIEDLKDKLSRQKAVIFVNFQGLKVKDMTDLRRKLKKQGIDFRVVKKTLLKLALERGEAKVEIPKLGAEIAAAFDYRDEITGLKILYQFSRENENLKIVGGIINQKFYSGEEIIALAKLPSKKELLARLIGSIASPISNFVNVLQGNIKNLITILAKVKT